MKKIFPALLGFFLQYYQVHAQNVGIGTTNPIYTADIADSISGTVLRLRTISNTLGDRTLLRMTTSASNSLNGFNSSYIGNQRQATGSALVFGTASSLSLAPSERMRLNESGFLGIGTVNPLARLHIDLSDISTTSTALVINDDDDPIVYFQRDNINRGFLQQLGDDFKVGTTIDNNSGNFIVRTNGADRLFVTPGGNIGIGISSPLAKLHIAGNLNIENTSPSLFLKSQGTTTGFFQTLGNNLLIGSAINTNTPVRFYTSGLERAVITENGNLGFGIADPLGAVHFDFSSNPVFQSVIMNFVGTRQIQFRKSNVANNYIEFSGDNMEIGSYAANLGYIRISTREVERLRVNSNGVIGINTTYVNDDYRLAVNGQIICTDITALPRISWPDYVFKQDYRLNTLAELEQFVKKNHHLPNIPSAEEIARNGIKLGDMQKRMMEKIEELTLYVIELNKKYEMLQKEIIQLKKNNN